MVASNNLVYFRLTFFFVYFDWRDMKTNNRKCNTQTNLHGSIICIYYSLTKLIYSPNAHQSTVSRICEK